MKLLLVDGSALLYRSHFAFRGRPLTTSHGELTSAAYGVATALVHLREDEGAQSMVVAFDAKGDTFRHEMYSQYKANRPPMPPELSEQVPRVHELVRAMGLPLLSPPRYEADDVLATLARQAVERGDEAWIYSGDKDFIPLVRPGVGILKPASKGGNDVYLDEESIQRELGLAPAQYLHVLALMGDKADNVPGAPGVGEKTALKLISDFESIEGVFANLQDSRIRPKLRDKLLENRELIELSLRLVTIDENVPLSMEWEKAALGEYPEDFYELCRELEFTRLLQRLPKSSRQEEALTLVSQEPGLAAEEEAEEDTGRHYELVESLERLDGVLREFDAHEGPISLDTETTSLDPLQAELVGISLCKEGGHSYYIPVEAGAKGSGGPDLFSESNEELRLPWEEVRKRVAPRFANPKRAFLGQNLKYDQLVLDHHGAPVTRVDFDTMIASYLLAPERRQHNLDVLAEEELGLSTIRYSDLFKGSGTKDIRKLPLTKVAEYAAEDADVAFRLSEVFRPRLVAEKLDRLMNEVELPLSQVLLRMERRGIRLDSEQLDSLAKELKATMGELEAECHELAGEPFNLNSPKQLQVILFGKLGLKTGRKTATGYSTDVEVLTRLAEEHPLPKALLEYRHVSKLLSTYAEALPRLVNPETGCVHTSFNQAVAATGRLSSTDPNLQNIPVRSALGKRIREAFIPREKGWCLLASDYSQIELRLMAHFAQDEAMIASFARGEDIHARTAAEVAGVELDEVEPSMRARAKAINFGILYGMGSRALAQQISVSNTEAKKFIEDYFARFPRVRAYIDETIAKAKTEGEVRTILGRRRRLPELSSSHPRQRSFGERIAVNTPIQGSAADLIKVAMIRLDARIVRDELPANLLLQVHDELVLEVKRKHRDAIAAVVREEMEGVFDLSVPLLVDISFGENWAEAKP